MLVLFLQAFDTGKMSFLWFQVHLSEFFQSLFINWVCKSTHKYCVQNMVRF